MTTGFLLWEIAANGNVNLLNVKRICYIQYRYSLHCAVNVMATAIYTYSLHYAVNVMAAAIYTYSLHYAVNVMVTAIYRYSLHCAVKVMAAAIYTYSLHCAVNIMTAAIYTYSLHCAVNIMTAAPTIVRSIRRRTAGCNMWAVLAVRLGSSKQWKICRIVLKWNNFQTKRDQ